MDGPLARGIRLIATLYRWVYPSALHAATPGLVRDSVDLFADDAEVVGIRLSDRVDRCG